MDIDRLHDVLDGKLAGQGTGRTTAMLIIALQNADFDNTSCVIITASERHNSILVRQSIKLASDMEYQIIDCIAGDEVQIEGDSGKAVVFKFMPFNLPDKIWIRRRGKEIGLSCWDHFATDCKKYFERYPKTGANEICPCGSGLKFKECHGRTARFR